MFQLRFLRLLQTWIILKQAHVMIFLRVVNLARHAGNDGKIANSKCNDVYI